MRKDKSEIIIELFCEQINFFQNQANHLDENKNKADIFLNSLASSVNYFIYEYCEGKIPEEIMKMFIENLKKPTVRKKDWQKRNPVPGDEK